MNLNASSLLLYHMTYIWCKNRNRSIQKGKGRRKKCNNVTSYFGEDQCEKNQRRSSPCVSPDEHVQWVQWSSNVQDRLWCSEHLVNVCSLFVASWQTMGRECTDDLAGCVHYALQCLSAGGRAASIPHSDAASNNTHWCPGRSSTWWEGEPMLASQCRAFLSLFGHRYSVDRPGEVLNDLLPHDSVLMATARRILYLFYFYSPLGLKSYFCRGYCLD